MIKLIIFDMDGLMFDTERLSNTCWLEVCHSYDYNVPEALLNETKGATVQFAREKYNGFFGEEFPFNELYQKKADRMRNYIKKYGVPQKRGLASCLEWAKEKGMYLALASSSCRDSIDFYLDKTNLSDAFNLVVSGDQVEAGKPHPEIFQTCCANCGVEAGQTLVLEDSYNGILAANRAGIKVVWIPDIAIVPDEGKKLIYRQIPDLTFIPQFVEAELSLL
ncbi:HAD family hydrolase [Propionispora vibrioides]|uniref:Haloacid dehalogenase superfamily, subfamily IA, variant 3 with third motif having DD or ED n=1 Tax=Propionispora vibrioides TaxID=112903 RepID=A0A1H8WWQ5_9FIRM|nr:HAD family phosphatase [Propionispora vibrioides]SEP32062.1 haloacid dehalogenase superfamily, subfamily IA, variant 3 with third motif having DD or ED [Propionispora vibrioides]